MGGASHSELFNNLAYQKTWPLGSQARCQQCPVLLVGADLGVQKLHRADIGLLGRLLAGIYLKVDCLRLLRCYGVDLRQHRQKASCAVGHLHMLSKVATIPSPADETAQLQIDVQDGIFKCQQQQAMLELLVGLAECPTRCST